MAADGLIRVRIGDVGDRPWLAWAEGHRVSLPAGVVEAMGLAARVEAGKSWSLPAELPPVPLEAAAGLRLRAIFTDARPASARLPVSYQLVPPAVRSLVASAVGRWNRRRPDRWAAFPGWPLDLSADFLADLASGTGPSGAGGPTPVMLSHDLDSAEGLDNLVGCFLPIEEAAGARSTSFIVPCAWTIDHARLEEVRSRGHAIGVHGYDHANRTPFAGPDERRRRLDAARPLAERYGAAGYRAPSLLRTRPLLQELASRYRYDSSVPTSGGLFPVPNTGCASARPFRLEGITEIPITLPRDGSLRFLGHTPTEIADMWIDCATRIARSGGVVMLLTHCEARFSGTPAMLDAYRRFIDAVSSSPAFVWRTPLEVAEAFEAAAP